MSVHRLILIGVAAAAGTILVTVAVRLIWNAIGAYRISRAGPRPLNATRHVLWRDPGDVSRLDLSSGPGGPDGAPVPPFRFIEEHSAGSQPCVSVEDGRGRRWRVKWGPEVNAENLAVRLVWACGYFAETTYFVASGSVTGATGLQRARDCVGDDCTFVNARFELDDPDVKMLFEEHSWAWNDNPFVGTPMLNGLKVLVMLLSDWDTKDRRDVARGSNTAIFEHRLPRRRREARYLITDWGGSMGAWGGNLVTRGRWDPAAFEAQTPQFITGTTPEGIVTFGYAGQRTADVATGISVADLRWLYRVLGALTDAQLRAALDASGATDEEIDRFSRALRERITQIGRAAGALNSAAAVPA